MRAVNLRSENKGLAEAETGRRQSSCPNQKDRSRPDRDPIFSEGTHIFLLFAYDVQSMV